MEELKPCPFCGGEASIFSGFLLPPYAECINCGAILSGDNRKEVRNAWNTRAERTCKVKLVPFSGWHCSACGELVTLTGTDETFRTLNYCPNCGAKVVSE